MDTYTITTVYPDGTTETRDATPEEVAQREADIAESERLKAEEEAWLAEQAAKRQSAINKLTALGLTEEEAQTIIK
jgi:hypothetical protein